MIKRLALSLLVALPLFAQSDPYRPSPKLPIGDTLLSLPSSHIPSPGIWEVKFTHRFNQSLDQGNFSDRVHSLFGLDANADVVFGGSYVMRPNLQLSLIRSNTNDTLEGAAKYVLLQQAPAVPLSLTFRGGVDWRTEKDLGDRTSLFVQAIVSRQLGHKAEVFVIPTFVTNAGRAISGTGSGALFDRAFNVPVGAVVMVRPALGIVAELVPPNGDLSDEMKADLGWAIGIKRAIGGHWFEVLLTNNQSSLTDQFATSTFQGSPLNTGDLHLGFNIERRFGRARR
ncbi:MAG TPA: DUF5777 family beta-barrel protein [Thermoanaerobaculia bacterium]|jgi:hypothetical protein